MNRSNMPSLVLDGWSVIPTIKVLTSSSNLMFVIKGLPKSPYKVIENVPNAHRKTVSSK